MVLRTISREDIARRLATLSAQCATSDWQWQAFGFAGTPRRGSWFGRFVKRALRAQERFLLREFTIASLARGLASLNSVYESGQLLAIEKTAVEALSVAVGVPQSLDFASGAELTKYLNRGLADYAEEPNSPHSVFFARAQAAEGHPFRPAWLVGIGKIFAEPGAPLLQIGALLSEGLGERAP